MPIIVMEDLFHGHVRKNLVSLLHENLRTITNHHMTATGNVCSSHMYMRNAIIILVKYSNNECLALIGQHVII